MSSSFTRLNSRPLGMIDAQHQLNQVSYLYTTFRGDAAGGTQLVYVGFARPGALTSNPVWQIRKLTYDVNGNVITMEYPQNTSADALAEFEFIWDNRTTYTYS
jgi:hypothetical protein